MAISLYDISVASYLQTLDAANGFLEKGRKHFEGAGVELDEVVETRIYPDMAPMRFQVVSVKHHSLGALEAAAAGVFAPPPSLPDLGYAELQKLVVEARDGVAALSRDEVDALAGREVVFRIGDRAIPFVAEDFIQSFSLPNFYFHATTAYDILRMKGVPIGKRDFMGPLRIKK